VKRNFRILLGLWILSIIGISLRGGPVTYGIFFLLTFLPVSSLIYIWLVILLFKIFQDLEGKELTANHPAVFRFVLQNESFLLFSGVRVRFYSDFSEISGLSDDIEYELMPKERIERKTDIVCKYRGNYEIGVRTIEVTDFFRFFTIAYRNPEPLRLKVKPDIVHLTELNHTEILLNAVKDSRIHPNEADVLMREYVAGDDPRLINWKASGAQGKLMIRERIGEQQEGIGILMDPHRYSDRMEDYLPLENRILETVIALNLFLMEQGIPVETVIREDRTEYINVDPHIGFDAFYARMANYRFTHANTTDTLIADVLREARLFHKKTVILVLHEWCPSAESLVQELLRNGIYTAVYLVNDAASDSPIAAHRADVVQVSVNADLTEVL
jgi:uncharacterized protein (DUF58 family)